MKSFRQKHLVYRRCTVLLFFLVLLSVCILPARAGGTEVTGQEYYDIVFGKYPTEATFTDTMVSTGDGKCASVMTELSGPGVSSPDAHVFTAHPGERFSFRLASPAKLNKSFFTTVFEDKTRTTAVYVKGKGIYELTVISQYLEVTDFGFETDLSDTSANVKLTCTAIGKKIADSYLESKPDSEVMNKLRNDKSNKETVIRITASAHAALVILHDLSDYTCATGSYEVKMGDTLADSTGFDFVLEDTVWTLSMDEDLTQDIEKAATNEYETYNGPSGLYYHTPAIVLVGSDLHSRASLPTDGFDYTRIMEKEEKDQAENDSRLHRVMYPEEETDVTEEKKPVPSSQNPSGSKKTKVTLTKGNLIRKGPGNLISVAGVAALAALSAAGAAAISSAASGSASAAAASAEEEEPAVKCSISINDGGDIPDILAGSGRPVSVQVMLEGAQDRQVAWLATVLPDPDKDLGKRLDALNAECAGGNQDARLNIICQPVSGSFHATLRISAVSAEDRKVLASKIANIKIKTPGIRTKKEDGKTKVILVSEGAVPGSAMETELKENQYEIILDENGKEIYRLKESGKEKAS